MKEPIFGTWNHRVVKRKYDNGEIWYGIYEVFYDEGKEKVERMMVGIGSKTVTLTKADFVSDAYIDIVIVNKSQENAKLE